MKAGTLSRPAPLFVLLLLLTAVPSAQAQYLYEAVDLGILAPIGVPKMGINEAGWIAGTTQAGGSARAFVYNGSMVTILDPPAGGNSSAAYDINETGFAVGRIGVGGVSHASVHDGTGWADLGLPDGATASIGNSINTLGQVAGRALIGAPRAVYFDGTWHDIGTLGGGRSEARAINENGVIVGWADTDAGDTHAFLSFSGGVPLDIDGREGYNSTAHDVSDTFWIAGEYENDFYELHGFLTNGVDFFDIAPLEYGQPDSEFLTSITYGVNNLGHAVGYSDMLDFSSHATLFRNGTLYDLNDLLVDPTGWELLYGMDINDRGWIAAVGYAPFTGTGIAPFQNEEHIILLRPVAVPEPGILPVACASTLGLLGAFLLRRRR